MVSLNRPANLSWTRRQIRRLLKPWHLLMAWILTRKIRHQHRELAKYVRRSAYEIAAWKQDIGFLDEQLRYHLLSSNTSEPPETEDDTAIEVIIPADIGEDGVTESVRQESMPRFRDRVDGSA